jgi:hypothetical protein
LSSFVNLHGIFKCGGVFASCDYELSLPSLPVLLHGSAKGVI